MSLPAATAPPVSLVQVNTEASATIKEATQTMEDEVPPTSELHHIKLISVLLKEAALDLPSFRATVAHLHSQLMVWEKWIRALRSSLSQISKQVKELRSYVNSFLEYLMPQSLLEGVVDQEYTQEAMNTINGGLRLVWDISLGLLDYSIPRLDATKDAIMERVAVYQTIKVRFDETQANYDKYLRIHMATPKLKDPVLVMEDALQLYSVRREYMEASLDLIIELNELIEYFNNRIVRFIYLMWHQKMERFGSHPVVKQLLTDVWVQLKRVSAWCDTYKGSVNVLHRDMNAAKKQIRESTSASFMPSNDLNDYRTTLVNSQKLAAFPETAVEKHGHLFMKTYVERSTKPVWVQRWAFLQGGVFGLLVLSPSGTAVQETDKIGALLCNTKYTPNEDRRFCFELKTIDTTLVFQAETVQELASWLKVFENVRTRILTSGDPMTSLFGIASNRYPPLMAEFANSNNTSTDRQMTNSKIINKEGQIITSSKLSAHVMKNQRLFQNFVYQQVTRIRLPFFTDSSRSTLIAYSLAGSTAVPTALSANIWGSLNWGCYYLHEDSHGLLDETDALPEEPFTKQIGQGIMVPANYPDTLLGSEIQMRALFESEVENTECCLLSFYCLWLPNSNQELRGTAFFTHRYLYFYLHALGFVALSKTPLEQITEASCVPKRNYDYMKIYKVDCSIKTKIFLGDGLLIARKINGIIKNNNSDKPLDVSGMINKLKDIEREYALEKERLERMAESKASPNEVSSFEILNHPQESKARLRVDFTEDMSFLCSHTVKLPPKAVFHALFGDKSHILDASYPIVSVKYITQGHWMRVPGKERALVREYLSAIVYHSGRTDTMAIRQEIEDMSDNEYYCIKTLRSTLKLGLLSFDTQTRIVLFSTESGNTKMLTYASTTFDRTTLFNPVLRSLSKTFHTAFANGLYRRLDKTAKVIGTHGQVAKAIYMYGKVHVTDVPYTIPKQETVHLDIDTIFRLTLRGTLGSVIRLITSFVLFVVRSTQMFLRGVSMHKVLVLIIAILSLMNVFLLGRSTVAYWQARDSKSVMLDIIHQEPMMMERAIYLKEVQELIKSTHVTEGNSTCFRIFQDQSFIQNYDQALAWRLKYEDETSRSIATNLRRTMREIGIRRNELIVSLQMLNQLEEDVAKGEWRNWLLDELEKCSILVNPSSEGTSLKEVWSGYSEGVDNLLAFCECCSQEMALLRGDDQDQQIF